MDPNETLRLIQQHIEAGEHDDAKQGCKDLYDWMSKGGFNPTWANYPLAAELFGKALKIGLLP